MCALRYYVKYLYRHICLEDISKKARITQNNCTSQTVARLIPQCLGLQLPIFGLGLAKHSRNLTVSIIFYEKHCRVMVIRRCDVTDITWVFARLEMKCQSTRGLVGNISPLNHSLVFWEGTNQIWASAVLALGNYSCHSLGGAIFE